MKGIYTGKTLIILGFLFVTLTSALWADYIPSAVLNDRTLEHGDNFIHGFTYFNGYLWASTRTNPCRILKIDPDTLNYERIELDESLNNGEDLTGAKGNIGKNIIVRINPHYFSDYASVTLYDNPMCDDMAYADDSLFIGSEKSSSFIYKINDDLTWSVVKISDTDCYGVFTNNDKIWGVYRGSPGKIVGFDLNLNVDETYFLPKGFNNANEIAFDPSGNLLYITCWDCPAKILKIIIPESPEQFVS
jgi:hypothetical protein